LSPAAQASPAFAPEFEAGGEGGGAGGGVVLGGGGGEVVGVLAAGGVTLTGVDTGEGVEGRALQRLLGARLARRPWLWRAWRWPEFSERALTGLFP